MLGLGAERGIGTQLDEAEARRHYKVAAEAGLTNAQARLGLLLLEGVEATERQLLAKMANHGVKQIDTADGKFDPNLHQAIAEVPGEGKPAGAIRESYILERRALGAIQWLDSHGFLPST